MTTKRWRWEITVDHVGDSTAPPRTNANAVGVMGPQGCDPTLAPADCAHAFRMYDDDGELYYEGVLYDPDGAAHGFEPLDDFGRPNAGCTRIDYIHNGEWQRL